MMTPTVWKWSYFGFYGDEERPELTMDINFGVATVKGDFPGVRLRVINCSNIPGSYYAIMNRTRNGKLFHKVTLNLSDYSYPSLEEAKLRCLFLAYEEWVNTIKGFTYFLMCTTTDVKSEPFEAYSEKLKFYPQR